MPFVATFITRLLRRDSPAFARSMSVLLRRDKRFVIGMTIAAGVICITQLPGRAAAGRAMTIDDLLAAIRVTDPQLSPDGSRVLFVRTTTDLKTGKRNGDIWSVATDGSSAARELIGGDTSENTPRFVPDDRQVAFISSRDGAPQVYIADATGGNVRKVTTLAKGVQPPLVVSGDGSRVSFASKARNLLPAASTGNYQVYVRNIAQ